MPGALEIQEYIGLAPYTTLKVGGRARFFARATQPEHVAAAAAFAAKRSLPLFILGGGSNVVISEREFPGLVLHIAILGKRVVPPIEGVKENSVVMRAAAGEDWDGFVKYCVGWNLAGIECLSGIPGFVGGTPIQNVGAYGQEVSETIIGVEVYDRVESRVRTLLNSECGFAYRSSIFNTTDHERYVVLSVDFDLVKGGQPKLAYRDLQQHFGESKPSLTEVRDAVIEIRRAKSMVIDPGDKNSRSVGSFFKNPVVDTPVFEKIAERFGGVPSFPADGSQVKIPAAWLIEKAGFHKGYERGNAGISTNHPLALVNLGGATSDDIIGLMSEVVAGVENMFAITLVPEPVFVGF